MMCNFSVAKESTLSEFFHTFNTLYTFDNQIIVASDRHPKNLKFLSDRLRSRLSGGLTVKVAPPQLDTQLDIMTMWAREYAIQIPTSVLEVIAQHSPGNIRELEGMFNHIVAQTYFNANIVIDKTYAEHMITEYHKPRNHRNDLTCHTIIDVVAKSFEVSDQSIIGRNRTKPVNSARQVAMYLARKLTDESLTQIGKAFGKRTHTTVINNCNKIAALMKHDKDLSFKIKQLQAHLISLGSKIH